MVLPNAVTAAVAALFSVFGFYCALRAFADALFTPKQVKVAVEIRTKEDAEMLDVLLQDAATSLLHRGHAQIVVLVSEALMDGTVGRDGVLNQPYEILLDRFGADCLVIE